MHLTSEKPLTLPLPDVTHCQELLSIFIASQLAMNIACNGQQTKCEHALNSRQTAAPFMEVLLALSHSVTPIIQLSLLFLNTLACKIWTVCSVEMLLLYTVVPSLLSRRLLKI